MTYSSQSEAYRSVKRQKEENLFKVLFVCLFLSELFSVFLMFDFRGVNFLPLYNQRCRTRARLSDRTQYLHLYLLFLTIFIFLDDTGEKFVL